MVYYLKIANVSCIGESNYEGKLENPFIEIVIDPEKIFEVQDDEILVYTIDILTDDLIFKIPIKYREATLNLDQPRFKIVVLDENDKELFQFVEESPPTEVRDTYYRFDEMNDVCEYRVPIESFEKNKPKIFKFNIDSALEQWKWKERDKKGKKLETIQEQKSVTVSVTALQVIPVSISASYTAGDWKDIYNINVQVNNQLNEEIDYELICVETDPEGSKKRICIKRTSNHPRIIDSWFLDPGVWNFISVNIMKNWQWWTDILGFFATSGPVQKTFNYVIEFTIFKTIDSSGVVTVVNHTFPPILLNKIVNVSQGKLKYAERSRVAYLVGVGYIAEAVAYIAATALTCFWCPALAAAAIALSVVSFALANDYKITAMDPIVFDSDFHSIFDYNEILEEPQSYKSLPFEIKAFIDSANEIRALNKTINTTYFRYYSALKMGDGKSIRRQKDHSEKMIQLLEDEMITLKSIVDDFKIYEAKVDKGLYMDKIELAVEQINKEGVTKEVKQQILKEGLTKDQYKAFEKHSPEFKLENFNFNISDKLKSIYSNLVDDHYISLKKVKTIRKIDSYSKNDIQKELLKQHLITYDEYITHIDFRNHEKSYILNEIESINYYYKKKLAKRGIFNTVDLLDRCSDDYKIIRFAKMTGLSRRLLRKWVKLANIMRIKGIGEEYARLLIALGYGSLEALSKEKSEDLFQKIKTFDKSKFRIKRLPSVKEIKLWVKSAQELIKKIDVK
jgi:hypothetical protein